MKKSFPLLCQLLFAVGSIFAASSIHAANSVWTGTGADSNWSTADNWSGSASPVDGDNLIFTGTTRLSNVNDLSDPTLGWLQFANGDFTLDGNLFTLSPGSSGIITNLAGTNTIANDLVITKAAKYWSVAENSELRLTGSITNTSATGTSSGWLCLTDGGTVRLMGSARSVRGMDLFNGTVIVDGGLVDASNDGIRFKPPTGSTAIFQIVNGGTVLIGGGGNFRLGNGGTAIGGPAGAGSLSVMNLDSGVLQLYGSSTSIQVGDTVAGAKGVFNQNGGLVWGSSGSGNTLIVGNSADADGTYNLNGGTLWIGQVKSNAGATNSVFNFNGGVLKPTVSSTTFFDGLLQANVQDGGAIIDTTNLNITIGQNLSAAGNGGLTKVGDGALTLSGTSTYTGPTVISNGTLNVTGLIAGSGDVTIMPGATLSGSGALQGTVSVQAGGLLSPGQTSGMPQTLLLQSDLTLAGDLMVQVDKSLSSSNDMISVFGSLSNTGSGTLTVTNLGPDLVVGDSFKIFNKPMTGGEALTILPNIPAVGGMWSNNLAVDGTIQIVPAVTEGTPADLTSLTLNAGTLNPEFQSNIVSYACSVSYTNSSVTLTPVALNAGSSIQIITAFATNSVASGNASAPISLNLGDNVIDVKVTSPDESVTQDYYITMTRIRPNVVLILADDQGFSDWGCYGSEIKTPNLDSLAATGLRFRNFYNAARCSPTRCALLTGLYTQQVAVDPAAGLPNLRNDNNVTIAELLQANGFRTYMSGKWHLGNGSLLPENRGFEQVFRYVSGTDHSEDTWNTNRYTFVSTDGEMTNRAYGPGEFYQPDAIGDYCLDYLDNNSSHADGKPFFMYVAFGSAHFPIQAPKSLVDSNYPVYLQGWNAIRDERYTNMLAMGVIDSRYALSPNEGTAPWNSVPPEAIEDWNTLSVDRQNDLARRMAIYASMIEKMDDNIGRIVQRLKDLGEYDNTLIIALSDNGGNFEGGVYGLTGGVSDAAPVTGTALDNMGLDGQPVIYLGGGWAHVSNTPFRLYKHFTHGGGIRTPMIVHWPEGVTRTNQWENQPGHLIDIMSTIVDVTGVTYPSQFNGHIVLPMEGRSLRPLFTNNNAAVSRELGFEHESNRAWIEGDWKLVTKNFDIYTGTSPANELELYDLDKDPSETTNLAYKDLSILADMVTNWNNWAAHVGVPSARYLTVTSNLPPLIPVDPQPGANDLFLDTFNRPDDVDADISALGMSGSQIPPLGANATYYEGYEGSGTSNSIEILNNSLRMAVGSGMSENGIMQNFVGQDIADAGGFSVELNVQKIASDTSDSANRYVGFGVGLTQAEAATGADVGNTLPPGAVSFRGKVGGNTGVSAFFVELDINGNVKVWSNGTLLDTISVGQAYGVLTASFSCTGFTTNDDVTVNVFFNGQQVDINTADTNSMSRDFHWRQNDSNYIGLSARASNYAQMDNLAIRKLPLVNGLITDYAMRYGLTGTNTAPDADPDGDGVSNFGEWAFGGDPTAPDAYIASFKGIQVLPGNEFQFVYQRFRNYEAAGLSYRYYVSEDLKTWTETTPIVVSSNFNEDKPDYEVVTLEIPPAVTANKNKLFLRILAETNN